MKDKTDGGYDLVNENTFVSNKKTYSNKNWFIIPNSIDDLKVSLLTFINDRH